MVPVTVDLYRPLKPNERELLNKLLEPGFPGRDELLDQLDSLSAKEIDGDGSLTLQCGPVRPAPVRCRVPTEGENLRCSRTTCPGFAIHQWREIWFFSRHTVKLV
jgi:hypothetical protein